MVETIQIDEERAQDWGAVEHLLRDAFGRPAEADLVAALRDGGVLAISLVAKEQGAITGYVGLSSLKSPNKALALAPLAVVSSARGRGLGARLVSEGLERARRAGAEIVFVLGDPSYYTRFGFSAEASRPYPCIFAGPYFMAIRLVQTHGKPEAVVYPEAFDALE